VRFATMADPNSVAYPIAFSSEVYEQAGMLDAIAAVSIVITAMFLHVLCPPAPRRLQRIEFVHPGDIFQAGFVSYVIGISMHATQYLQHGGYLLLLSAGRGAKFEAFASGGLSWPYVPFTHAGLGLMFYGMGRSPSTSRRAMSWGAFVWWLVLLVPQGDRLLIVQSLIVIAAAWYGSRSRALRVSKKNVAAVIALYVGLAVLGQIRNLIAPTVTGEVSTNVITMFMQENTSVNWFYPERTDIGGPYLSLLYFSANAENGSIHPTNSYLDSLLWVLPKALYPGVKQPAFSEDFAWTMHRGSGPVAGWGFNSVAEAYSNFGTAGIFIVFTLWTALFFALDRIKQLNEVGLLLFSILLASTVTVNRMDFRCVYCETVYAVGALFIALFLAKVIGGARRFKWNREGRRVFDTGNQGFL